MVETVLEIMECIKYKQRNVLTLTRGYVFNTEYVRNAESLVGGQTEYFKNRGFSQAIIDKYRLGYAPYFLGGNYPYIIPITKYFGIKIITERNF